jgi:hypothetical protein
MFSNKSFALLNLKLQHIPSKSKWTRRSGDCNPARPASSDTFAPRAAAGL